MNARRGFALAAVLATLVILSMVVAVAAQRALLASRRGALELARADIAAALVSGQVVVLDSPVDSARLAGSAPGTCIAEGALAVGTARAQWVITRAAAPFATVELEARASVIAGTAREVRRALIEGKMDSLGVVRWVLAGGAGWVRVPRA
jgi:type II secretory pathway pseudopilin PulG